jgi:uncharacterized protein YjbI with pentapeptide repeats
MTGAKFDGADLTEVIMSKAYAVGASFKGTTRSRHQSFRFHSTTFKFLQLIGKFQLEELIEYSEMLGY